MKLEIIENAAIQEDRIEPVVDNLKREYRDNKKHYDRFDELRQSAVVTGANVRRAAIWVVGSIKTRTELVDENADSVLAGDFGADKEFLESTTDGSVKWDRYGEWFTSDIPDRVTSNLKEGRIDDAHALLSGRDPLTGERLGDYYLRANKASLVLYLLGYDRVCVDTRVYNALNEAIRGLVQNRMVQHPETELSNPYRNKTPRQDAKRVPVMSHSGGMWPGQKTYWEDKLKWNIPQYRFLTDYITRELSERSGVPKEMIPQVAFNLEGERTIHEGLLERLD